MYDSTEPQANWGLIREGIRFDADRHTRQLVRIREKYVPPDG